MSPSWPPPSKGTFASKLKTYTAPAVLVIDDVKLLPLPDRRAASGFFHVVNSATKSTTPIVTTNRSLRYWGEVVGDPVVVSAIRLMHDAVVFVIRSLSWRLREHHGLEIATTNPTKRSGG